MPLESELSNGDVIEIFTSKDENSGPSQDWLQFVKSPRARTKIKSWFSKSAVTRRSNGAKTGSTSGAQAGLPPKRLLNTDMLTSLAGDLRLPDVSAVYAEIGENRMSAESVVERLLAIGGESTTSPRTSRSLTAPTRSSLATPASSCRGSPMWRWPAAASPVPGDQITGIRGTRGSGVSVHRRDCPNVEQLSEQANRIVEVEWAPTQSSVFLVNIQVEALDRSGLLSDVTRA